MSTEVKMKYNVIFLLFMIRKLSEYEMLGMNFRHNWTDLDRQRKRKREKEEEKKGKIIDSLNLINEK